MRSSVLAAGLLATTALAGLAPAYGARIDNLWDDHGPARDGIAVSNDGTIYVAGAKYYTPSGVVEVPGPVREVVISGLSGDGSVVVGSTVFEHGLSRAFRWTNGGVPQDLGSLIDSETRSYSGATGVSGDGSRVVGWSNRDELSNRGAFIWVSGATGGVSHNEQMFQLVAADTAETNARAISDNGNFVVGTYQRVLDGFVYQRAMRWDVTDIETSGPQDGVPLGNLGGTTSWASAVSGDGTQVVGTSTIADGRARAFLWTEGGTGGVEGNLQMRDLGTLGGNESRAEGISSNGHYVVGSSEPAAGSRSIAFRWSEEDGMVSVAGLLADEGVDIGSWILKVARDVSDDGQVIVGTMNVGDDERAYLVRLNADGPGPGPGPGPGGGGGIMDVKEYHQTLFASAGIANAGEYLSWLPMNGAHHRPLMMTPNLSGDMCAWATGDLAHHGGTSTGMGLAEAGACVDLAGGSVRLGTAVGISRSWQDLALGGSARMAGQYVLGEADWQPDGTPLLFSVTGMLGGWQANIERAYSNGAATAVSSGQTNAFGGVVRVRADWLEAAQIGNTSFNPYASIGFGHVHVDGYAETGGPFPARFDAQNLSSADIRIGLTAVTEFSAQTKLSTTFEVAHRSGTAAAAKGSVDGLFAFNIGGGSYGQTWLRAGLELDHKVTENLALSTSLHMATNGRDPSVAGSVGIKAAF
ncbi:autotransporter domain-containing protein [Devosia ginsengisoli]|uniref:autotransporter domain-containing protein n=1 Tax=Devosia ginsengisoli TaxID=400770 RepID=UPI001645B29D|nr:autotransporter domain-containing protein [Devosia ginsengisoli]